MHWCPVNDRSPSVVGRFDCCNEQQAEILPRPLTINNQTVMGLHGLSAGRSVQDPLRSHSPGDLRAPDP